MGAHSKVALNGDVSQPHQMAQTQEPTTTGPAVQEEEGVLVENDHPVVPGVFVRAASLPALTRLLVHAFDSTGQVAPDKSGLPSVVLRMHRWFTSSTTLADLLTAMHRQAPEVAPCNTPECSHRNGDAEPSKCPQLMLQTQVCHAIRFWILNFPMHFDLEPELAGLFRDFQAVLSPTCAQLVDLSQVPSYEWMRQVSVRSSLAEPTPGSQHSRKVSLVFNHLQPLQLAEHLTFLEHKVMRRIVFQELRQYVRTNSLRDCPKLERSVSVFNGLTQWIQCMVLSRTTPQQRAEVIAKFIDVAQKLRELQNFNSLMAVVGAVSHSVLARLSRTMACLSADKKRLLSDLTELLSSANNFGAYRRELRAAQGFKIPILGIHLKDLVALHTALPDKLDGEMLNVRKMAQLSLIFQKLERLQLAQPPIDANMDLVNTLRLSLDLAYTEDEIYELSLAREPRNSSSPQYSPTQSVLFAEWASSPCPPPDPQTIEKHVNAMVEAVFKNYDNDRDGYISHDEFEAVAGNFPFIASFCVLDADHDGMISQWEMKKYFIHANCHALKNNFKHEFHETTYFKPTFCSHCAGLLWGLIRQGYKCRDCGINAHKQCKDLVVMECRTRSSPAQGDPSSHATNSRRRFRRKKKSSLSESESSPSSPKYSTCDSESSVAERLGGGGGGSLPPSPKPGGPWTGPRRKISDSLLVPSQSRSVARLRPQNSCPESSFGRQPSFSQPSPAVQQSSLFERSHPRLSHQAAVTQPSLICEPSICESPPGVEGGESGTSTEVSPSLSPVQPQRMLDITPEELRDIRHRLRVVEEVVEV